MVNNTSSTTTPTVPASQQVVPGWDYWALTVLGAPVVSGIAAAFLLSALRLQAEPWAVAVLVAVVGAAAGWVAPSVGRLTPLARVVWVGVAAVLAIAVPVVALMVLIVGSCPSGGCFS